jgi:hypothetical protein
MRNKLARLTCNDLFGGWIIVGLLCLGSAWAFDLRDWFTAIVALAGASVLAVALVITK